MLLGNLAELFSLNTRIQHNVNGLLKGQLSIFGAVGCNPLRQTCDDYYVAPTGTATSHLVNLFGRQFGLSD